MRFLLSLTVVLVLCALPVRAGDVGLDEGRAAVAVNIFAKSCFMNMGNMEKTEDFLNAGFQKHDEQKKQPFLDFTKTEKGDVWLALAAQGMFAIVLSDIGNCHVVAQKVSREDVHTHIGNLAEEAKRNMDYTINIHGVTQGSATKSSGFDVVGPDGKNFAVVVASTPIEPSPDKPDTVITLAVSSY